MIRRLLLALGLIVAPQFFVAAPVRAQDAAARGLEIAREQDRRESGFGDWRATLSMTLRSADGKEAVRRMRMLNLEMPGDGDRSLLIFDAPKDVAGTALLTWSHKVADDDAWLYLPSLARVKRIASNNKSGAFMGSEFAFEDIGSQEVEKFRYRYLRDETLDGQACTVVEQIPTYANSGYSHQIVWRDQKEYRVLKIEYYDRRKELLKTSRQSNYQRYLDKFWFAGRYDMMNHKTGRSTVLAIENYVFGNRYTPRDFDQKSLESAR